MPTKEERAKAACERIKERDQRLSREYEIYRLGYAKSNLNWEIEGIDDLVSLSEKLLLRGDLGNPDISVFNSYIDFLNALKAQKEQKLRETIERLGEMMK